MNDELKKYLEDGLAESYVLGIASKEEKEMAESLAKRYPEFDAEVKAIENALQSYASLNSKQVPSHLKEKIFSQLFNEDVKSTEGNVKQLNTSDDKKSENNIYRYLVAASVALLFLSVAYNIYLTKQLNQVRASLNDLKYSRDDFANALNIQQVSYKEAQQKLADISKPEIKKILLKGNDKLPGIDVSVFWNNLSHAVYINTASIPPLEKGKQYQLWALENGKPVDAGVFDGGNSTAALIRVKDISDAQTFAVTVEPAGGLPSPTMSTLCLIGNI